MNRNFKLALLPLILLIPFCVMLWGQNGDGLLHFYTLDVGQGDSLLIQTPKNRFILIDGGPEQNVMPELGTAMPFFSRTFEFVIMTHPDSDHMDGLLEIVDRYEIKKFVMTGMYKNTTFYSALIEKLRNKNIPVWFANSSNEINIDGVHMDILSPLESVIGKEPDDANDTSIVIKAEYNGSSIMLTGDASVDVEKLLLRNRADLDSDILKAGHHGSRTSSSPEFVEAVSPSFVIISVGADNKFGHPHSEAMKIFKNSGAEILRTDTQGRIECGTKGGREWECLADHPATLIVIPRSPPYIRPE